MSRGLALPRVLGGYLIEGRISEGGMGAVVLGRKRGARGFAKQAAIKVLLPQFLDSAEVQELFFSEARLAARLSHPNVCQVYDFGEQDGLYYLVMEYIRGKSLAQIAEQHLRRGDRMPLALAAQILAASARGLHHAHTLCDDAGQPLGVVHRDVSPQNVLITFEGHVKVLDFGIAKSRDRATATQQGILRGKPAYMSPEQARGDALDARSDIFSLGTVFYELCTHRTPFARDNVYATIQTIGSEQAADPRTLAPDLPEAAARIINCALSFDREQRFANAEVMARALDQLLLLLGQQASEASLARHMQLLFPDGPDPIQPVAHGRTASQSTLPLVDESRLTSTSEDELRPLRARETAGDSGEATGAVIAHARGSRRLVVVGATLLGLLGLAVLGWQNLGKTRSSGAVIGVDAQTQAPVLGDAGVAVMAAADAGSALRSRAETSPVSPGPDKTRSRKHRRRPPRSRTPPKDSPKALPTQPPAKPTSPIDSAPVVTTYGSLSVPGANPYFNVRLDGRLLGATPIIRRTIPSGEHEILIEDPSTGRVVLRRQVTVIEGVDRRISEHLSPP